MLVTLCVCAHSGVSFVVRWCVLVSLVTLSFSGSPFVQETHVGWWRVYQGAYAKVNSSVILSCGATAVSLLGVLRSVTKRALRILFDASDWVLPEHLCLLGQMEELGIHYEDL